MEVNCLEEPNVSNDINYVPSFVDIEGLQGVNSTQGMNLTENNQFDTTYGLFPTYDNNMQNPVGQNPMYGMDPNSNPMMGMDPMMNMGPVMEFDPNQMMMPSNMNGMNMMQPGYPNGMAGIMTCVANMCYMTSVMLMQMVNGGYFSMTPMSSGGCGNCGQGMMPGYNPYSY